MSYVDVSAVPQPKDDIADERYYHLKCLERNVPVSFDDMSKQSDINEDMMVILFDWLYEVCQEYNLDDTIFSSAIYIIWNYIHLSKSLPRNKLQLVGCTALFIAFKCSECDQNSISLSDLQYVSDGVALEHRIVDKEKEIAQLFDFNFIFPTVNKFVAQIVDKYNLFSKGNKHCQLLIDYLTNLAIIYNVFPKFPASIVAEAIVGLACPDVVVVSDANNYTKCQQMLQDVYKNPHPKYKAARDIFIKKYSENFPEITVVPESKVKNNIRSLSKEFKCNTKYDARTENKYVIKEKIGEGSFGKVFSAKTDKNADYVVKVLGSGERGISEDAIREVSYLKYLNHPNIVKIFDPRTREDEEDNGELRILFHMERMTPLESVRWRDKRHHIKKYACQMLQALNYIHERDVIHRDLKPSNMLLHNGNLILADFGLAIIGHQYKDCMSKNVVTAPYRAPEVILGQNYNSKIDIWAAGCTIAELITANHLFQDYDDAKKHLVEIYGSEENIGKIAKHDPQIFDQKLRNTSPEGAEAEKRYKHGWSEKEWELMKDLLSYLLAPDPNFRFSAKQALSHEYFTGVPAANISELNNQMKKLQIGPPIIEMEEKKINPIQNIGSALRNRAKKIRKILNAEKSNIMGYEGNTRRTDEQEVAYVLKTLQNLADTSDGFINVLSIWSIFYYAEIFLDNVPAYRGMRESLREKAEKFAEVGYYFGHYIGMKQNGKTEDVEQIREKYFSSM